MAGKSDLTAVYVILGRTFLETAPYDAKGAFVLLRSIEEGLDDTAPGFLGSALHLHMVAALGGNEVAKRDARSSMGRVVSTLERRLASAPSA